MAICLGQQVLFVRRLHDDHIAFFHDFNDYLLGGAVASSGSDAFQRRNVTAGR